MWNSKGVSVHPWSRENLRWRPRSSPLASWKRPWACEIAQHMSCCDGHWKCLFGPCGNINLSLTSLISSPTSMMLPTLPTESYTFFTFYIVIVFNFDHRTLEIFFKHGLARKYRSPLGCGIYIYHWKNWFEIMKRSSSMHCCWHFVPAL